MKNLNLKQHAKTQSSTSDKNDKIYTFPSICEYEKVAQNKSFWKTVKSFLPNKMAY